MDTGYCFNERSGQYIVTPASRFDLTPDLRAKIHDEAVSAYMSGASENNNPYPKNSPAFLQWEHSFDEYKETAESYYEMD
jgi:hypothetical protein